MERIPTSCSPLQTLALYIRLPPSEHEPDGSDSPNLSSPTFIPPLTRFSHLKSLGLRGFAIRPDLFSLVATFPLLSSFSLTTPPVQLPSVPNAFPGLVHLDLGPCSLPAAASLLNLISSRQLGIVSVTTRAGSEHRVAARFLPFARALARFRKLESVSATRSSYYKRWGDLRTDTTDLRELVEPLLTFRWLHIFNLELGQTWAGNDDLMKRMAGAWLHMQELTLIMPIQNFPVSLETFAFVLAAWENLRVFSPGLDTSTPITHSPSIHRPNVNLQKITLTPSEDIADDYDVAPLGDFFRVVCPSVRCCGNISWGVNGQIHWTEDGIDTVTKYINTGKIPT